MFLLCGITFQLYPKLFIVFWIWNIQAPRSAQSDWISREHCLTRVSPHRDSAKPAPQPSVTQFRRDQNVKMFRTETATAILSRFRAQKDSNQRRQRCLWQAVWRLSKTGPLGKWFVPVDLILLRVALAKGLTENWVILACFDVRINHFCTLLTALFCHWTIKQWPLTPPPLNTVSRKLLGQALTQNVPIFTALP